jgi:hypothetical protein
MVSESCNTKHSGTHVKFRKATTCSQLILAGVNKIVLPTTDNMQVVMFIVDNTTFQSISLI